MVEVSDHWEDFHQLVELRFSKQKQTVALTRHFRLVHPSPRTPTPTGQVIQSYTPPVTSLQSTIWALHPETTNTNLFPEVEAKNQLLGVAFTNKALSEVEGYTLGMTCSREFGQHM